MPPPSCSRQLQVTRVLGASASVREVTDVAGGAVDWDSSTRRQIVYLDDGSGQRSVNLNASFNSGAWLHFPISVGAGGTVTIRVDRTAGSNATLSGLFLGGS